MVLGQFPPRLLTTLEARNFSSSAMKWGTLVEDG